MAPQKTYKKLGLLALASVLIAVSGCSSQESSYGQINDPAENINRKIFAFNDALDTAIMRPIAKSYRWAVPQPIRMNVRNFLRNLKTPVIMGNELLQGDVEGFAGATMRGLINTTFGFGGIADVAGSAGIPYEPEDFGQTLAVWGLDHGAYMMIPLMGPSSLRDATGLAVDTFADPLRMWARNTDNEGWWYARVAAQALDSREELLDVLDGMKRDSIDYYAAMRSSYVQRREALVRDESAGSGDADIPEYN